MKSEFLTTKLDRRTVIKTAAAAGVAQICEESIKHVFPSVAANLFAKRCRSAQFALRGSARIFWRDSLRHEGGGRFFEVMTYFVGDFPVAVVKGT